MERKEKRNEFNRIFVTKEQGEGKTSGSSVETILSLLFLIRNFSFRGKKTPSVVFLAHRFHRLTPKPCSIRKKYNNRY